jgi:hypothetical protein
MFLRAQKLFDVPILCSELQPIPPNPYSRCSCRCSERTFFDESTIQLSLLFFFSDTARKKAMEEETQTAALTIGKDPPKTRRWGRTGKSRTVHTAPNRFAKVAGLFIFPLMSGYDGQRGAFNLLEFNGLILGKLIWALGEFAQCLGLRNHPLPRGEKKEKEIH